MLMRDEREALVEYGKRLSLARLCPGTSGNLSIYDPQTGYMAITHSGIDYFSTRPEDIAVTALDGNIVARNSTP